MRALRRDELYRTALDKNGGEAIETVYLFFGYRFKAREPGDSDRKTWKGLPVGLYLEVLGNILESPR